MMKGVQVVGFEQAVIAELPIPAIRPNEILARIRRAGVCHSDVEVFRQELSIYRNGGASLPIIPGHEWAGEVVKVGSRVTGFEVGEWITGQCGIGCGRCWLCDQGLGNICPDRVETGVFNRNGAYAEYIAVPFTHAHHLYDLSPAQGALVEPATVGLWIARRATIGPGQRVIVFGTGTVGLMATQAARLAGADLVVSAGRKVLKLDLALKLGAHQVINLMEQPLDEMIDHLTKGQGFNVVVEATGSPLVVTMALRTAIPRGTVVITGLFEKELQTIDLNTIMPKELTVIGSLGGPQVFDEAIEMIGQGKLQVLPLNTHTFPLEKGPEALVMVANGHPEVVKIHLDV